MADTLRRERGGKVGNGTVKREIVRFLLLSDGGCAPENGIRAHLYDCFQVSDRTTIRNQHLGYLKTKGIIDVKREPGKENFWFIVNTPSIVDYVFAEFQGNELIEIYRANFFQDNIAHWFIDKRDPVDDSHEDIKIMLWELIAPATWEQHYLTARVFEIQEDVLKVSPSRYCGSTTKSVEGNVITSLLMFAGRGGTEGEYTTHNTAEIALGTIIADLLVDFDRYVPLQRNILDLMKRNDFLQLFRTLYPGSVIGMVFRALSWMSVGAAWCPYEEREQLFEFELPDPLTIPPAPPDWENNMLAAATKVIND